MLTIYNTLSKKLEPFVKPKDRPIRMYVCGPTVYDHSHIGHGRAYTCYDMVYRYLQHLFGIDGVIYVRNVTDVEDKIIQRAIRENTTWKKIADTYLASFLEDLDTLKLKRPNISPRVSDENVMKGIVEMISALIDKKHAYVAGGDVYFAVETMKDYGKLSGRNLEDLKVGARVEVGEQKRNPLDFALWKAAKPAEPTWESPWGKGKPGWHIECSAMTKVTLGETIDLHAGGMDLIFPHHENEVAQSECANGTLFSKTWIHNGFITLNKEKMSKSLGNTFTLKDVIAKYPPEAIKLYIYGTHYRAPMEFSTDLLEDAVRALSRLYRALLVANFDKSAPLDEALLQSFEAAMNDDFNTPKALAVLYDAVTRINRLVLKSETRPEAAKLAAGVQQLASKIFGILEIEPQLYFQSQGSVNGLEVAAIESKISERAEARSQKNFTRADEIRKELQQQGIELEDSPEGTFWRKA